MACGIACIEKSACGTERDGNGCTRPPRACRARGEMTPGLQALSEPPLKVLQAFLASFFDKKERPLRHSRLPPSNALNLILGTGEAIFSGRYQMMFLFAFHRTYTELRNGPLSLQLFTSGQNRFSRTAAAGNAVGDLSPLRNKSICFILLGPRRAMYGQ